MPTFTFKSPEGKTYNITGPEGATQEQAWGILQGQLANQKPPAPTNGAPNMNAQSAPGPTNNDMINVPLAEYRNTKDPVLRAGLEREVRRLGYTGPMEDTPSVPVAPPAAPVQEQAQVRRVDNATIPPAGTSAVPAPPSTVARIAGDTGVGVESGILGAGSMVAQHPGVKLATQAVRSLFPKVAAKYDKDKAAVDKAYEKAGPAAAVGKVGVDVATQAGAPVKRVVNAVQGGASGFSEPVAEDETRAGNVAKGAVAGFVGGEVGNALAKGANQFIGRPVKQGYKYLRKTLGGSDDAVKKAVGDLKPTASGLPSTPAYRMNNPAMEDLEKQARGADPTSWGKRDAAADKWAADQTQEIDDYATMMKGTVDKRTTAGKQYAKETDELAANSKGVVAADLATDQARRAGVAPTRDTAGAIVHGLKAARQSTYGDKIGATANTVRMIDALRKKVPPKELNQALQSDEALNTLIRKYDKVSSNDEVRKVIMALTGRTTGEVVTQ